MMDNITTGDIKVEKIKDPYVHSGARWYPIILHDQSTNASDFEAFYLVVVKNEQDIARVISNQEHIDEEYLQPSNFYVTDKNDNNVIKSEAEKRLKSIKYNSWDDFYNKVKTIYHWDRDD